MNLLDNLFFILLTGYNHYLFVGTASVVISAIFSIILIVIDRNQSKTEQAIKEVNNIKYDNTEDEKKLLTLLPNFDIDDFKIFVLKRYEEIQYACINGDDEYLSKSCSCKLKTKYLNKQKQSKEKGIEKINSNFELISINIPIVKRKNDYILIVTRLSFSADYSETINEKVLIGSKDKKTIFNMELYFKVPVNVNDLKCSNCGASLEGIYDDFCEYCRNSIYNDKHNYILLEEKFISIKTNR